MNKAVSVHVFQLFVSKFLRESRFKVPRYLIRFLFSAGESIFLEVFSLFHLVKRVSLETVT